MATVVLQVVGAAIGGAIGGPFGATLGRAVGAVAGYAIDQQIFSKDQVIKGGRLDQTQFLTSLEGTPVPKVYGRVKTGGQLIWATRFEERRKRKKRGGKGGGPSITTETYTYFANFAVGICEGPITRIGRVWADGEEMDQSRTTIRFYPGSKDQEPDPLIEALQGQTRTPAFRGTAYAVFEDLPLADYGNRIPQITFEVIRSIASIDREIQAITLIPGAGEFAYSPVEQKTGKKGRAISENRHVLCCDSDWQASLDELQALCPNLERVSLVVAWFGTDLRAGECSIEPRCIHDDLARTGWQVGGLDRQTANLVSRDGGNPAYGGSPSDQSVIDAIVDLKTRGLKVALYPFLMMDIPPDNTLPNPYSGTNQPAYPWRGRVTCSPAIGIPGSADQTALAAQQIAAFVGTAMPSDFTHTNGEMIYSGPGEFSYRRMILHYANLCNAAGGVERFFIGSEMRGLTQVRDENGDFPFVSALVMLAHDVKAMLQYPTEISYAADWSEYFGYHPQDGSNDVCFNLDPLWASADIAAVSIDNYMPVSDWKEAGDPGQPEAPSRHAVSYLQSNIAGGEGYDWYYASLEDRLHGNRTPVTDSMGEPWIWSFKALKEWWLNAHHERTNGVRTAQPTQWQPQSKPVWFSEIGCPAVDRGTNQPNVFVDAKSSESAVPYHSRGGRDDLMQLRYLQAVISFWRDAGEAHNPVSTVYSGRMIEPENIYPWAWDARPFPAFPQLGDVWSDGINWYRGHWVNGRLGTCPLDELLSQILVDHSLSPPLIEADGHLDGYLLGGQASPRQSLDPLIAACNLTVSSKNDQLQFTGKSYGKRVSIDPDDLVQEGDNPALVRSSLGEHELAQQLTLSHGEIDNEYHVTTSLSRRLETASRRQQSIELPAVICRQAAIGLMNARLQDQWAAREQVAFSLSHQHLNLEPGDQLQLGDGGIYQVSSIASGTERQIEALRIRQFDEAIPWQKPIQSADTLVQSSAAPFVLAMNLPIKQNEMDPEPRLYFAAFTDPWRGSLAVLSSISDSGFEFAGAISNPALMFELLAPLEPGPIGLWDNANTLLIRTLSATDEFSSLDAKTVFGGANAVAVRSATGEFEIVQFRNAELIAPQQWRLSALLRGQMGTVREMLSGSPSGEPGVVLDDALLAVMIPVALNGIEVNWRAGPSNEDFASSNYSALTATCTHVSKRPLQPVHIRLKKTDHGLWFNWIRQSRVNADDWTGMDIPLDFTRQRFRVSVSDMNDVLLRTWESDDTQSEYTNADRHSDLGSLTAPFKLSIAQLDDRGVPGPPGVKAVTP